MISVSSRRLLPLGVFALTIAGAFSGQIEYSLRAQGVSQTAPPVATETPIAPAATPPAPDATSPAESTEKLPTPPQIPTPTPQIDAKALDLLLKSAAAYANLKSFSVDVKLRGSDPVVPLDSTLQWQKPNRLSTLNRRGRETFRVLTDGKTIWARRSSKANEYLKIAAPKGMTTFGSSLHAVGLDDFFLSLTDELTTISRSPSLQVLTMSPTVSSDLSLDTVIVALNEGKYTFDIDKKTNLLRRVEFETRGIQSSRIIEEYSNLRVNPALSASIFTFVPRKTDKLFTPKKPAT